METAPVPEPEGPITLEEFERMQEEDEYGVDLVRGWVVREPRPAPLHGRLGMRLGARLHDFVEDRGLGVVLTGVGFLLQADPPTVRAPDLAFVSQGRIPPAGYGAGRWRLGPDLAVEILSPSNRYSEMQEKVFDYFEAGTSLVWIVEPNRRGVTVYDSRQDIRLLTVADELDGGDVLPRLRLRLSELFDG